MVRFTGGLLLFSAVSSAVPSHRSQSSAAEPVQHVLSTQNSAVTSRQLKGKFLHITDFHPDPFYKVGTRADGLHPCHSGQGKTDAGYYGTPLTSCDAPYTLVNATFKWIEENLKDEIDFVIWTGDSARHDNDEKIPRSNKQVQDLNRYVVRKFFEVFGKQDAIDDPDPNNDFIIPIVPTLGNNDILPHNIFEAGPNRWTRAYLDIWRQFVPEEQRHSFTQGGWFYTEVIPNKLVVFSLNTLYFYHNNFAVDGCDLKSEPGYEHMEWLRVQLQFVRQRGMKAILMGHVPPARTHNKQSWDESCWQKYTLWVHQYRDIIVGSVYGHANIDYFMLQDVRDLKYDLHIKGLDHRKSSIDNHAANKKSHKRIHLSSIASFLTDLRTIWSDLPTPPEGVPYNGTDSSQEFDLDQVFNQITRKKRKKRKDYEKFLHDIGGPYAEHYSTSFVSPSVVANYFPSLRVMEYNISGLGTNNVVTGLPTDSSAMQVNSKPLQGDIEEREHKQEATPVDDISVPKYNGPDQQVETGHGEDLDVVKHKKDKKKKRKKKKKKKRPNKPDFPVPLPPSHTSLPGPAYSPQTFSFLSLTQYYANLTRIEEEMAAVDVVVEDELVTNVPNHDENISTSEGANKDQKGFRYEIEYATCNDRIYNMPDLTVRSWLHLAEKIGKAKLRGKHSKDAILDVDVEEEQSKSNYDGSKPRTIEIEKKKKHKKKNKLKDNHIWHTFLTRAMVSAKSDKDLEDEFD